MKILIYFSGRINESKGTPIRVRNVLSQFKQEGAKVFYAGHEKPDHFDDEHFLKLDNPFLRPFIISSYVRRKNIEVIYIQTAAGIRFVPFFKLLTRAKVGLDFHSLWFEEKKFYQNLGYIAYHRQKYEEIFLSRFLDFATGVSRKIGEYYRKHGGVKKYFNFPVGVDLTLFHPQIPPDAGTVLWKGKSILLGYAGNTKYYQGIDTVLEALDVLEKKNSGQFKLLLVASSGAKEIEDFSAEHHLAHAIKIIGKQSHENVPPFLSACDIFAVVRPSDMITEYAFPSKFSEHAALGKAMVVSHVGDLADYIEEGVSGMIIPPSDTNALVNALLKLSDKDVRERFGRNIFALVRERLDIAILGKKIYHHIETLCQK
ncbi:MAG: glycosyltransferase family 4 protein [Candidatus Paceibacterota bacterium]|jgi:glycosyltransferase involved in cell wall biosynthesis